MKNMMSFFSKKALLMMAVVTGGLMAGCGSNSDYSSQDTATSVDTLASDHSINHDTMSHSTEVISNTDTSAATVAGNTAKDTSSKAGKVAKKGKVSIIMETPPVDKTAVNEMDKEGFYKSTEVLPGYPGGQKALERFFEDNIQYPEMATENNAEGTVKLTFAVDENGKIYQPLTVGNKIGYGLEEEAIRVFNKMPKWTPGKIKGKNVKTRFTLPVRFQLY